MANPWDSDPVVGGNPWDADPVVSKPQAKPAQSRQPKYRGMIEQGNIDLAHRPVVRNKDGTISTVRSMSANFDGREVLIPTVSDDGRIMSDREAIDTYMRTGRHLGIFDTPQNATAYANQLHNDQARMYADRKPAGKPDFSSLQHGYTLDPKNKPILSQRARVAKARSEGEAAQAKAEYDRMNAGGSATQQALIGAGDALDSMYRGLKQTGASALAVGTGLQAGLLRRLGATEASNRLVNQVGIPLLDYERQLRQQEAQNRADTENLAGSVPAQIGKMATYAGTALAPGFLARGTAAAPVLMPKTLGGNAALGAAYGATQPYATREEQGQNAALSAAFGAGLSAVPGAVRSASEYFNGGGMLTKEMQALYRQAKAQGIQLTPAQLTDSAFVKRLSMMLDKLPFSGAAARNNRQQSAGNAALARVLGENGGMVDQTLMGNAADRIGANFDTVFQNGMKLDRQFLRDAATIKREAGQQMDETAVRTVNNWVERLRNQSQSGQISGRTLQSLDQSMRKAATGGGDRQQAAQAFRDALHEAFGRQAGPAEKAAWDQARRQWAALKTVEPVVARNPDGVPMQQLQGAINATQRGRTLRSRGRDGAIGELASIGQLMKSPSSSGTAENLQSAGLGAGLVTNPIGAAASIFGGRAVNNVLGGDRLFGQLLAEMMAGNGGRAAKVLKMIAPPQRSAIERALLTSGQRVSSVPVVDRTKDGRSALRK